MDYTSILIKPVITEKANLAKEYLNMVSFMVANSANKVEVSAREPGPCTTTRSRSFEILASFEGLTGEIAERSRIDGPEECGETPTGLRTRARLDGIPAGAP